MDFNIRNIISESGIDIVDIILLHEWHPVKLYEHLSKYKNETFSPTQRLIFVHDETEFVASGVRFTLYNLQLILFKLMIPNFACLVLSQQDVKDYLIKLNLELTNDIVPIDHIYFEGYLDEWPPMKEKTDINVDSIEKHYISLNNLNRMHRRALFNWLQDNSLLDYGLVSIKKSDEDEPEDTLDGDISHTQDTMFLTTIPMSWVNDGWVCRDYSLEKIFQKKISQNFKNFEEDNRKLKHIGDMNSHLTQRAFCYISNETVFNYPGVYTSEKSFKAFSAMRPMISYGTPGIIKRLQKLGFKTWNDWWSEDYDEIQDNTLRFKMIAELIRNLTKLSINECKEMLLDMQEVLEHNQNYYVTDFLNDHIRLIKNQLLQNLKR